MVSIDDSYTDDDYDDGYISIEAPEDIRDGKHVHTYINARYARLKIREHIRQAQSECKGAEI